MVSSIHKRKILSIDRIREAKTFADAQAGFWSVLGMKVDATQRLLWATATAFLQMVDLNREEENTSAV